jgi:hypothetical protein
VSAVGSLVVKVRLEAAVIIDAGKFPARRKVSAAAPVTVFLRVRTNFFSGTIARLEMSVLVLEVEASLVFKMLELSIVDDLESMF